MKVYLHRGGGPVLLAQPHAGTHLTGEIRDRLNETGRALADTDWHVDLLYEGLLEDATVVRATTHRYVIDVNRDPGGASLYPGMNTTGLCPTIDFDGRSIYEEGEEPGPGEIESRRAAFHAPYHDALAAEIERIRRLHGVVILYDCHSIRSNIPYLFEGTLPVFNIGTFESRSCSPAVERLVESACAAGEFSHVLNGRFKGGWTTRHYGAPADGVHAVQMEIAQRAYMEEAAPWTYLPDRAEALRTHLKTVLEELRTLALSGGLAA